MADSGFPTSPRVGAPTYYFGHFPRKLHEIETIGPGEGICVPNGPLGYANDVFTLL